MFQNWRIQQFPKKRGGGPTQDKKGGTNHMTQFKCIDRPKKRGSDWEHVYNVVHQSTASRVKGQLHGNYQKSITRLLEWTSDITCISYRKHSHCFKSERSESITLEMIFLWIYLAIDNNKKYDKLEFPHWNVIQNKRIWIKLPIYGIVTVYSPLTST